jgi:hypothetical protein
LQDAKGVGGLPLRWRPGKLAGWWTRSSARRWWHTSGARALPYPHDDLDAVARALGADAAARLRPRLEQLVREAVYWPVDWSRHDLDSASQLVQDGMVGRHPELSGEAMAALMWEFGYSHI